MNPHRSAVLTLAAAVSPALAQPHAADVILTVESARIVTNSHDGPTRVFASEFMPTSPPSTDEPGFDCEPGTFPPHSWIGFRILDALRAWDGTTFDPIAGSTLDVAFSTLSVTTPAAPQVVEGFSLQVNSLGEWHRHLEFTLGAPAATGVYLLTLELHTSADIEDSRPFWIVFNNGADEAEHDRAVDWVRFALAGEGVCDPDVNCDGAINGLDVEVQELAVGGELTDYCAPDPDFNRDGAINGLDVEAVELAVGGAPCE